MFTLKGILYVFFLHSCVDGSTFDNIRVTLDNDDSLYVTFTEDPHEYAALQLNFNILDVTNSPNRSHDCSTEDQLCRSYEFGTTLIIKKLNEHCQTFNFSTFKKNADLEARIGVEHIQLYGGAEHSYALWPSSLIEYSDEAFVTSDHLHQSVLEPYWVTSNGYFIYIDKEVPLFVSSNARYNLFYLAARYDAPYQHRNTKLGLNFTVCQFENPRKAHEYAIEHFLGKPTDVPDPRRVKDPIWSTWSKFKTDINETKVRMYAKEIAGYDYGGQLVIEDNWETCYGSMTPNLTRFPNLRKLVNEVNDLHLSVSLFVHPFVNEDCDPVYTEALQNGYLIIDNEGNADTTWWRGIGSFIDFTNPAAVQWYRERLEHLRNVYGIDSFKFDGGESSYVPEGAQYHIMAEDYPETIVKEFVKMIAGFGTNALVRVARGTQQYPIFVTMTERESNWHSKLGLHTLIPELLHMNIIGYSFVLPDVIGGNLYEHESLDAELFIRWLQANVFMPSLQFSVPPWEYGEKAAALAVKFVNLHERYADKIIELMRKNVETGAPVNPPLWWIVPKDPVVFDINSEFLLGEEILVAPVLQQGATKRDIYLPEGFWRDENNHNIIQGPIWLMDYKAGLSVLPYFTKVSSADDEDSSLHSAEGTFVALLIIALVAIWGGGYVFIKCLPMCRNRYRLL